MTITVSVPASSANLGPGYDSFGMALGLRNEFSAELADSWFVSIQGEGAGVLLETEENQVVHAMKRVFSDAGKPGLAASVVCRNAVPVGCGLGSSSAAIVGGIMLADALIGAGLTRERIFELASELEGHPDNVAAAIFGGVTVCWSGEEGVNALRIEPAGGFAAVLAVSDQALPTSEARAVLPAAVPHADAAFNVSRAALLVTGIASGDRTLVGEGLADRIHERYRAAVVPDLVSVEQALVSAGADGAALSGAGPSVIGLVLGSDDAQALEQARGVARQAAGLLAEIPRRSRVIAVPVDRVGAVTG